MSADADAEHRHTARDYLVHGAREALALLLARDPATIAHDARRLTALTTLRPQEREPDLLLAFAPVKRIEFLAEKATELGAAVLGVELAHRVVDPVDHLDLVRAADGRPLVHLRTTDGDLGPAPPWLGRPPLGQ